ncbi:hypothetical protein JMJ35_004466 [Cladonia borealis]|uniref:Hypervirulence associated protein TUDOR domain-containing protein n=1 Tax=Cladonia borealis TaxID=184061 RepID=A0AA39V8R8_9LECA|nr:hypothetical protein JMJ35_004466 [Cladonia borealis]
MAEPEVGDKASWNWNGSAPSGEVAEKKTEGEVAIQSKRGNTIKKDAKPNDPAIHLARPGNDVVKNQSELQVEEKKSGDDGKEDEKEDKDDEGANGEAQSAKKGEKRKAEDDAEGDGEGAKKARGRPKGAAPKKAEPKAKKEKAAKPTAATNGEKKSRGRPKGAGSGGLTKEKKEKKEKPQKAAAPPTGIGKRTRSSKK